MPTSRANTTSRTPGGFVGWKRSPRRDTLAIEPVPFWHDGAVSRLAALAALEKT
jgi:hypothetical protein